MPKTKIAKQVRQKINAVNEFILENYKSETTALRKSKELRSFAKQVGKTHLNARCRYNDYHWHDYGYLCASLNGWVFAYKVVKNTVFVMGLEHSKNLKEVIG